MYKMEERGRTRKLNEQLVSAKITCLWGMAEVQLADDLTSADQEIPDQQVKITILDTL